MGCFVVAGFVLTSASCDLSTIAELLIEIRMGCKNLQEGLAVAKIARDDRSPSTNHSSDGYD